MNLIQSSTLYDVAVTSSRRPKPEEPRVLEQARRRVAKPPDERRRDILGAATRLFSEKGFDATAVQMIADESKIAAGTIYLHFASKEAILAALHEDFESGLLDRAASVAAELLAEEDASDELATYEQVVERLVDAIVAYTRDRRDLSYVLARHGGRESLAADGANLGGGFTEVVAGLIREGVRRGYVASSDPEMAAYLLEVASGTAIRHAIASDDHVLLDRVVRQTKELYIKALRPTVPLGKTP